MEKSILALRAEDLQGLVEMFLEEVPKNNLAKLDVVKDMMFKNLRTIDAELTLWGKSNHVKVNKVSPGLTAVGQRRQRRMFNGIPVAKQRHNNRLNELNRGYREAPSIVPLMDNKTGKPAEFRSYWLPTLPLDNGYYLNHFEHYFTNAEPLVNVLTSIKKLFEENMSKAITLVVNGTNVYTIGKQDVHDTINKVFEEECRKASVNLIPYFAPKLMKKCFRFKSVSKDGVEQYYYTTDFLAVLETTIVRFSKKI